MVRRTAKTAKKHAGEKRGRDNISLRRPASSKRGSRESSDELKAKYLLAPVMMEAAAAQRFTFSTTSSSSRSLSLLCSDGARSCNFWHDLIGCACNYECRIVLCVSCVLRVLGLA